MASCCMMMPPLGSLGSLSVNWKYSVPTTSHCCVQSIFVPSSQLMQGLAGSGADAGPKNWMATPTLSYWGTVGDQEQRALCQGRGEIRG